MDLNTHLETHHAGQSAKYIKNIIFGGLDGIITTFSIIAAAVGAQLEQRTIIILSIANLFADAISMGVGEYISSKYENIYINSEYQKEEDEYNNNLSSESEELIELYTRDGLSPEDSEIIVNILTSKPEYKSTFLKYMVKMELGLDIPDKDFNIKKAGFITGLSFTGFGFIPILFYLIFYGTSYQNYTIQFLVICIVTILSLILLGIIQAHITKQNKIKNSITFALSGILAATTAFLIGYGLELAIN